MTKKPSEEAIRELAHHLWEQRGRPHGRSEEDWFAAEKRLSGEGTGSRAVDESAKESFPASDAPSSNLPDEPPVNAEEKWEAAARKKRSKRKGASDEGARPQATQERDNPRRSH
jgi:hypothetical protein